MLVMNVKVGDSFNINLEDGRSLKIIVDYKDNLRILVDAPKTIIIDRQVRRQKEIDESSRNPS